ncbi:serine hydrolase [Streptococcus merionis]|uniref:serine hydrolase n=1 Tax=Streptococcus merionis TaxID=400065 RepID=UPI0026EA3EDA|nr:serine hydrolase [Streptococcus merionis]
MKKYDINVVLTIFSLLALTTLAVIGFKDGMGNTVPKSEVRDTKEESPAKEELASLSDTVFLKSPEAKQAVMEVEQDQMVAYGLYFDYANMTLPQVVQAYLDEIGMPYTSVAFSYKNTVTGEVISMNETQLMTAGSTYKLPLNMLIVDGVETGEFSMDQAYDIADLEFENESEYLAYRSQFGDDMTISEMQEYSLVYSENTPAYGMVKMLGGFEQTYSMFERYGKSRSDVATIDFKSGNKTTSDYYIQVLDYLWHHQEKYKDILYFIGESFPGQYFKTYLPYLTIYQKPGYYAEALNVDAIVYEETPYLIALYTAGLGGADAQTTEINGLGYVQLTELTYVINQWHRVNQNP